MAPNGLRISRCENPESQHSVTRIKRKDEQCDVARSLADTVWNVSLKHN